MSARRIEYMALGGVAGATTNPKRHDDAGIAASIDRFGYIEPVVIDERTGRLVAGHGRVESLRASEAAGAAVPDGVLVLDGSWSVPVVRGWASKNDREADGYLLASNRLVEAGGWDNASLLLMLEAVSVELPLEVMGFDDAALAMLRAEARSKEPSTDVIPESAPPKTVVGDVWLLGPNRVMCGDSASPSDVDRLMDGRLAQSMVTDPPYGVDYGDTVEFRRSLGLPQRPAEDSYVKNDGLADALGLWATSFPLWIAVLRKERSAFYCWGPGGPPQIDLGVALRESGGEIHGSVIWVKSSFSFSRADHKYQHEPCWYGWRADGTHEWCGPNNESSVWEYPKPSKSDLHPTQKPVELIRRCVRNITSPGGLTVDPFLGSGTTLIAAHLEGRICFGMEIEPKCVDVICRRWQEATGVKPVAAATGTEHDFCLLADMERIP